MGVVRGKTKTGEKVEKLEIEAYEEKANEVLKSISEDLKKHEGIVDVQIHHFLGEFKVGRPRIRACCWKPPPKRISRLNRSSGTLQKGSSYI